MHRRHFLRTACAAAGASFATLPAARAAEPGARYVEAVGLQLYTLRDAIGRDLAGTIRAVAEAGYHQVEPYGFPGSVPMIAAAKDAGLAVHSSHFDWDAAVNPGDEEMTDFRRILEAAREQGLSHLVVPYLHERNRDSLAAYQRVAENLSKAAALSLEAGIRLSYHNHAFEFEPRDGGRSGFDVLVEEASEELRFELDVFWVQVAALSPVELIGKLGARVSQLHLKDLKPGMELPNFGGIPQDAFKELGAGMIPMREVLAAAEKAGVEHCHVEQDHSPDPLASIRQSIAWLRGEA